MFIKILSAIESLNDKMFGLFDEYVNTLPLADFVKDAVCDSVHLIPFLFIIFVFIELFEVYFSHKLKNISNYSKKVGPLFGALLAALPQCGFSVIATPLYINRIITKGTLLAIYISTSDEAIPILLSYPEQVKVILPLLAVKIILGCSAGYLIDVLYPPKELIKADVQVEEEHDEGCCSHHLFPENAGEIILHPIKHTFSIFVMILIISLGLNYCFEAFGNELFNKILLNNSILQPILAAITGLIPNCAVSVLLTMLYISGVLSFASVVAGLSSGAGLGLIVLLKRNPDKKDTAQIIGLLLGISIIAGFIISIFH
ncbi:MAG: arsenic efflux protein [Candidatus Gastranaerophilales bacterium]|nr:arsenic efflux protein [Candidatus Gastranaerophilales bacterium]